jgi:hypothetical protein
LRTFYWLYLHHFRRCTDLAARSSESQHTRTVSHYDR